MPTRWMFRLFSNIQELYYQLKELRDSIIRAQGPWQSHFRPHIAGTVFSVSHDN